MHAGASNKEKSSNDEHAPITTVEYPKDDVTWTYYIFLEKDHILLE